VPEFESRRTAVPPFFPTARPDADIAEGDAFDSSTVATETPQREGLPPGYRMRHDSHYVDQLTTRTAQPQLRTIAIREIESARTPDARDLEPLVRSIAKYGVIQPVIVRSRNGRFELVAGARRLRAAGTAGLSEVPCVVHTCDDARARALAEAENLRPVSDTGAARPGTVDATPSSLNELRQSVGTIESCLQLLVSRDTSLRDRVALDLIRTEAHRASRLVQSLHVLSHEPALALTDVSVRGALEAVLEACAPERRLGGVQLTQDFAEGAHTISADPEWFSVGLSGVIGGMLALVQSAKAPLLQMRLTGTASGPSIMLEIAQQVVSVPAWALSRFFDAAWTDRPGGYQAAVELAAARKVIDLHRGGAEILTGERGGCRIVMVLPTSH
jgi:ParB-like chromosome segregation protein Spo0J